MVTQSTVAWRKELWSHALRAVGLTAASGYTVSEFYLVTEPMLSGDPKLPSVFTLGWPGLQGHCHPALDMMDT